MNNNSSSIQLNQQDTVDNQPCEEKRKTIKTLDPTLVSSGNNKSKLEKVNIGKIIKEKGIEEKQKKSNINIQIIQVF